MTNVIPIAPHISTRTERDDVAERQSHYLLAWCQATDDKCGRATTIQLMKRKLAQLERQDGATNG